jgi:hypothetical protein
LETNDGIKPEQFFIAALQKESPNKHDHDPDQQH